MANTSEVRDGWLIETRSAESMTLKDRMSGHKIYLTLRDGTVVGAMGSEPRRYLGLTEAEARHKARYSNR